MSDQTQDAVVARLKVERAAAHAGKTPWEKNIFLSKADDKLIGLKDVIERTGLGRSAIYERIRSGTFPAPAADQGRSLWSLREVTGWQQWRLDQRGGK